MHIKIVYECETLLPYILTISLFSQMTQQKVKSSWMFWPASLRLGNSSFFQEGELY